MKKPFSKRVFEFVKNSTDQGILLRVRSFVGYFLGIAVNLDWWILLRFRKPLKTVPLSREKYTGIISTYRPIFWHGNIFEMSINKAVREKGGRPVHIVCRGVLEVCDVHTFKSDKLKNPMVCSDCRLRNDLYYGKNDAEVIYLDDMVEKEAMDENYRRIDQLQSIEAAMNYEYRGYAIGRWAHLSVCRYWMRLSLDDSHLEVYKRYLKSAAFLVEAYEIMFQRYDFDNFMIFNGRYVTFHVPLEIIKRKKIQFSTYEMGEQEKFTFSVGDISVMWNDVKPRFERWLAKNPLFDDSMRNEINNFMELRQKNYVARLLDVKNKFDEPCDIAVFTNLIWDSAAFGRETLFSGQFEWIQQLIKWAEKNPRHHMVIRIHPAETADIYNKTMERMSEFIRGQFPNMPKNVGVIEPFDSRSSYQIVEKAKVVTVYSSSIGLESVLLGKNVLMAAWSHYAIDGLTHNPRTQEDYFQRLEQLADGTSQKPDIDKAIKYVYWYYRVYHRLNNTNLYHKPLVHWEDSRFFRVPNVKSASRTEEFKVLFEEFNRGSHS